MTLPAHVERLALEVGAELADAVEPLLRAAGSPPTLFRLLHQVGWDLRGVLGVDPAELATAVEEIRARLQDAARTVVTVADAAALAGSVAAALELLDTAARTVAELAVPGDADDAAAADHRTLLLTELVADVGEHLLLRHLQLRAPTVLHVARLIGVVGPVRQPVRYLVPDPGPGAAPVRVPLRRLGLRRDVLGDAFQIAVTAFLGDRPGHARRSLPAALGAALAALGELVAELATAAGGRELAVAADGTGITLRAPGVLPTDRRSMPWTPLDLPLRPTGPLPRVQLGRSEWTLVLAEPPQEVREVSLVDGLLHVVDRLPGAEPAEQPGLTLTMPGTGSGRLGLRIGLRAELGPESDVLLAADVTVTAGAGGVEHGLRVAVLGEVALPLALPGFTGLAFVVDRPIAAVTLADLDTGDDDTGTLEARVDLAVDVQGFALQLPEPLFRRAVRDDPAGPWRLEGPPPRVKFTRDAGPAGPILSVGTRIGADGRPELDRLEFLPLPQGTGFTVTVDPIFLGGDDPEHGFVISVADFTVTPAAGETLAVITVERAEITLPAALPGLPNAVIVTDATIDEAGFTGRASLVFDEPAHSGDPASFAQLFGVLPLDVRSVTVGFEGSVPTEFAVEAAVQLPWFDDWVEVAIGLDDAFALTFEVASSDPAGIILSKAELLELTFRSAALQHDPENAMATIALSGGLRPLLWSADGLAWPRLEISDLVLKQDLRSLATTQPEPPVLRFREAWVDLAELATLDLFGFHFELSRVGVGYVEDADELWVDLSGSLRVIDLIPVGVGVEGFRITWPRRIYEELQIAGDVLDLADVLAIAARVQVRFAGVELAFGVPQAVEFASIIRFFKNAQAVGFAGDAALRVPAVGLAVEGGILVGVNLAEQFPFLFVQFGIVLPAGIPLAQSGLALKGAQGLLGFNVEPDREPEQNPYHDWYKRPPEGAHPTVKWRDRNGSIAFGAGITITTVDGVIMGVRGLLGLVLPGPVVFVEGKAVVFDGVFPGDGPLTAFAFFDGTTLTAQFSIEAALELVEGVVDVRAGIEAYFDFQAAHRWHLYLGQDQPPERRVYADVLLLPVTGWLFGADAWLMLDMVDEDTLRSRLGVHIGFEPPPFDLVVSTATLRAVVDGEALLTVNPAQITGGLTVEGALDVDAFGLVALGVDISAALAVEAALPLVADLAIAAQVELPVPDLEQVPVVGDWAASALDWFEEEVTELPEIPSAVNVELALHWELDAPPVLDPLVREVTVQSPYAPGGGPAPRLPTDPLEAPVMPLDARPTVVFNQHVNQAAGLAFAGYAGRGVESFRSGGLRFRPTLLAVRLWALPRHDYVPGQTPDSAWTLVADTEATEPDRVLWGAFRPAVEGTGPPRAARRTLDLLSGDLFAFLGSSVPVALPAESALADRPAIPPGAAFTGPDAPPWCEDRDPALVCVSSQDFRRARRAEALVAVERAAGFTRVFRVDGVAFESDDLRFGGGEGQTTLVADSGHPRGEKLLVRFSERVVRARLTVAGKVPGLAARRGTEAVEATIMTDGSTVTVAAAAGFDSLLVIDPEPVVIVRVCWTGLAATEAADALRRDCERNAGHGTRAAEPPPVLTPGHLYRLEIDTAVELDEAGSDPAALALSSLPAAAAAIDLYRVAGGLTMTDRFCFRTAGPPAQLDPYVRWISPPNGSTGHFPDDDIVIRFRRPHVHRLYPDADNAAAGPSGAPHALAAVVTDADGRIVPGWFLNWTTSASATLLPEERRWYVEQVGVAPPPDDVLEIRRRLTLRAGTVIGDAVWRPDHLGPLPPRRTRWRHGSDGLIRVAAAASGTSLYVTGDPDGTSYRVDVEISRADDEGQVGLALLYDSAERHYQLRVTGASVELVRVSDGRESVLAGAGLAGRPGPFSVAASATVQDGAVHLDGRVGTVGLQAVDPTPLATAGRVGLLASATAATFAGLAVSPADGALTPGRRYTVRLVGGEGGRPLVREDFTGALGPGWSASGGTWTTGDYGLQASGPGALLQHNDPFDDGELLAIVAARPGERLRLALRTPDARRAPGDDGHYWLTVTRTATVCEVECAAAGGRVLARGEAAVGAAPRLHLRVRLLGDQLAAWIGETPVLDVELNPVHLRGGIGVNGSLDPAALLQLELRDVALLTTTFTTSTFMSFADMLRTCTVTEDITSVEAPADDGLALVGSQRRFADAAVAFGAAEATFSTGRTGHADLETARQGLLGAALAHDERFVDLLVALDGLGGLPLTTPRLRRAVTALGSTLGYLLQAPESLDPELRASADATPHKSIGRTSFTLLDKDGDELSTAWLASSDGTAVLVHRTAGPTGSADSTRTIASGDGGSAIRIRRRRDVQDDALDDPAFDHIHDRPYVLSGGIRSDVIVDIGTENQVR